MSFNPTRCLGVRWCKEASGLIGLLVALLILPLEGVLAQTPSVQFRLSTHGGGFPTIDGQTNLPDGTQLFVTLKKPWLPDGAERIAHGLAACGEDCIPAQGPDGLMGIKVTVERGRFTAGPFSFRGGPAAPAIYPVEISPSYNLETATIDQIKSIGTVLYSGEVDTRERNVETEMPNRRDPYATEKSPPQRDMQTFYASRYFLAGFLLRASKVCSERFDELVANAFGLLSTDELKKFSRSFVKTTSDWMTEGSNNFNNGVMTSGIDAACRVAFSASAGAKKIRDSDRN